MSAAPSPPDGVQLLTDGRGAPQGRVSISGGRLDGEAEFYGEGGELVQRARFREGELHGALELYDGGRLRVVLPHVGGRPEGEAVAYAESGAVTGRSHYSGGRRNGPAQWYDGASGRLLRAETYRDDRLEGEVVDYFPSGKVHERSHYRAGLLEGERTTYGEDGEVQRRVEYREGREVSVWTPPPPAPPPPAEPPPPPRPSLWARIRLALAGG